MEWWHWVLIALVALTVFTWWISRLPGERGNEEDFRKATEVYLNKAAEYYEISRISPPRFSRSQLQGKLTTLIGDYRDIAKRFDFPDSDITREAINTMHHYRHAIVSGKEVLFHSVSPEQQEGLQEMKRAVKIASRLYDEAIFEVSDGQGDILLLEEKLARVIEIENTAREMAESPTYASDDLLLEFSYLQESRVDLQRFVENVKAE